MSAEKWPGTRYPETCVLIEAAGIDPIVVAEDGFSASGYFEMILDENGKRIITSYSEDAFEVLKEWREWPSPEAALPIWQSYLEESKKWGLKP